MGLVSEPKWGPPWECGRRGPKQSSACSPWGDPRCWDQHFLDKVQAKYGLHSHFMGEGAEAREARSGARNPTTRARCAHSAVPRAKEEGGFWGAFVLQPDSGPSCSLFWAMARWGISASAFRPPVCSEGLGQQEVTREGDLVSHPPWGLSLASRFCFPSH